MDSELRFEVDAHVGVITINRPEARNALTLHTYDLLERAVRQAGEDGDLGVRCLVITGEGSAFCSGDDVKQVMGGGERPPPDVGRVPRLTPAAGALLATNVPVIAAVNGPAVGWGMELSLMCDIRIASERARFGELFVLRGLCTDMAGIGRLAGAVGRERAAELLFTGDVVDAATAHQLGLVSRVVPAEELMATAMALATRIAANPPLAVQAIKEGLRRALDPDYDELGRWVSSTLGRLFTTDDHREGVKAFLEKRAPVFTGS